MQFAVTRKIVAPKHQVLCLIDFIPNCDNNMCISPCYADPFSVIVLISAYLACAGTVSVSRAVANIYMRVIVRLLGIVLADISQYGS